MRRFLFSLALCLWASGASGQIPTPTPCPEGQARLVQQVNGVQSYYCGTAGTEAQAIATATAVAQLQAEAAADDQEFADAYAAALARLAQIRTQMTTIQTQAQALSTVTLSGATVAALRTELQGHLRQIGQGVDLLAKAHDDEARYLTYLAKLVRRERNLVPGGNQGLAGPAKGSGK